MNTDYILLDTGDGKRLEQFGGLRIIRSAKQADWRPTLGKKEWESADAVYENDSWSCEIDDFSVHFDDVSFSLSLLDTGQVGIFPEQMDNWKWLAETTQGENQKILNGFAYTGGSTLFASNHINSVTHLDASKPAVKRAKLNRELSFRTNNNIRFIQDDVISFMEKELKRGNKYNGFIFDPPAFGKGGKGKKWKLTKDLPKLMELIYELADGAPDFLLISAHDPAMDHVHLAKMIKKMCSKSSKIESGELTIPAQSGNDLRNGYFARCRL
jgi:23S rRNA (cytosine1962-C5)-methyltransferase